MTAWSGFPFKKTRCGQLAQAQDSLIEPEDSWRTGARLLAHGNGLRHEFARATLSQPAV
jgi:hypothetical protein